MDTTGKLLIIGDDAESLQTVFRLLGTSGLKVSLAVSCDTTLDSIEACSVDLILLDIFNPDTDGYEMCQRHKSCEHLRDVPVMILSASQERGDQVMAFKAGAVDYVSKPFRAEEVIARMQGHVERYQYKRTLEQRLETGLRECALSESRNRILFRDSPLALIVYDSINWRVLDVNAACTSILGYSAEKWVGEPLGFAVETEMREALRSLALNLSPESDRVVHTGRLRFLHHDGYVLETEGVVRRFDYPGHQAQILILQDTTERRKREEHLRLVVKEHRKQLELSEHYDALTGLPNRTLLDERMRQGLAQSQTAGSRMAVFYLDIDAFGLLNASHGQEIGDHLLINTAECLRSCLRGGDTLVRIGSDEFALLVLGLKSDEEINLFLMDLQARLAEPFISDTAAITLSASIGMTIYPHDRADPETLLRHALQAMIMAKQSGPGRLQRFDPENDRRTRSEKETVDGLRAALSRREFVLYYQPKVDLKRMQVVGAEALIRWQHPKRGLLPPGAFLPAIENDVLMIDLGYWVVGEALTQMDRWRQRGLDLPVSVNIAAQQLVEPDFVARLRKLLAEHPDVPLGNLEIEVLETSELEDIGRVEKVIVACREMGIGFSLDDFGTGYSSLTYLRRLSADTLKIDQSFVSNMLIDPGDEAIISGVIGLAAAFQRKVIAEGVETIEHARSLLALGCVLVQGYGIARPMPAEALPEWIENWPDEAWGSVRDEMVVKDLSLVSISRLVQ